MGSIDAHANGPSWPPIDTEEHQWQPATDVPRRWQATFTGPYRAAVTPSIAELEPRVSAETAALADEATSEIARFDAEIGHEIAPFSAVLLRTESAASSRIEHLTASAKAIALAELGDTTRRNAAEIAANTDAMNAAIDLADRLDANAILSMHRALLERVDPSIAGAWREQPVWIGTSGYGPHTADFVPPHHTRIAPAIGDLVRFMRRDDLPVVAQAAIVHAQFETIHPFVDGNGRTGRALVHSLLRSKRLARTVTVPISAGLLTDPDRYVTALTAYRTGDIEPIVARFAEAAFDGIANGRRLVADLHALKVSWSDRISSRPQATVWKLLDLMIRTPVIDAPRAQRELEASPMGVDAGLRTLVEIGAVEELTGNRRNRRYAAIEVLTLLDAFAERAGRRAAG